MMTSNGLAGDRPGPASLFQTGLVEAKPPRPKLTLIPSDVFAAAEYKLEWLVKKILVKGQPAVWGGPKKSLKTNTLVDLALALGAPGAQGPGRFLGHFDVPEPVRVALFSGESGEHTLQETARRIAQAREIDLAEASVHWGFSLPKVASRPELGEMRRLIEDHGLEVVIVDPLYLSLLGGGVDVDPRNLYSMGPVLLDFARTCLDHGCTPILAHHAKKGREKEDRWEPLDLDDLAFSGISEFARQWMLINRRVPYEEGTGRHELWLKVGGSVGFSGLYGLDIAEGEADPLFAGRIWDVRVRTVGEVRGEQEQRKEESKEARKLREKSSREEKIKSEAVKLFRREHPARLSSAELQRGTGWRAEKATLALALLQDEGILRDLGKVKAANGRLVYTYGLVQPPRGSTGDGSTAEVHEEES